MREVTHSTSPANYEFTVAQIAREAAREVRMAVKVGKVSGALAVVNTVLASPLDPKITPYRPPSDKPGIIFERPIPSRLVTHTFVHALMRDRYSIQSGIELQKMVDLGLKFHSRTLRSNIALLCSQETHDNEAAVHKTNSIYETQASPEDSSIGHMILSQSWRLPPKARLAVNLLSTARQRRHRRTEDMYGRLIDVCLLQGEIVIATLLFVLLVKDWQLRRVLSPTLIQDATMAETTIGDSALPEKKRSKKLASSAFHHARQSDSGFISTRKRFQDLGFPALRFARQSGLTDPSFRLPCPEKKLLEPIIKSIDSHVLSRNSTDETRLASVESMSLLAAVVADKSISLQKIAPLLRCLQNCPSSPALVMTAKAPNGKWRTINAYNEVHKTLLELCHSLPEEGPRRIYATSTNSNLQLLPRLDPPAYNSLIHYALRHRMSPALANKVIKHMVSGKKPLQPDIATYNILLRSASLLTRNDLASRVLHVLSELPQNSRNMINMLKLDQVPNPIYGLPSRMKWKSYKAKNSRKLAFVNEKLVIPVATGESNRLQADHYTLSSYITYIVSTGRPEAVVHLVSQLFPDVEYLEGEHEHELTKSPQQQMHRKTIQRAVECGPYVLSVLLNALCKAGKTGIAERIWKIAQEAEEASWQERNSIQGGYPWCLPIQAYTSMLQCYEYERRKGLVRTRGGSYTPTRPTDPKWQPAHDRLNIHVKGWAGPILLARSQEREGHDPSHLRSETSLLAAWRLVNEMRDPAATVWEEFMRVHNHRLLKNVPREWAIRLHSLRFPAPDERFFNVLLSIFGNPPIMPLRGRRQTHSRGQRMLRLTRTRFTRDGDVFRVHDPTLLEVVRMMGRYGYDVPLGLRRILVGRPPIPVQRNPLRHYKVHPWAFPKARRGTGAYRRPFSLEVFKTRGLPVQRISKRRMGLNPLTVQGVPISHTPLSDNVVEPESEITATSQSDTIVNLVDNTACPQSEDTNIRH